MSNAKVRHRRRRRERRASLRHLRAWVSNMAPILAQQESDERLVRRVISFFGCEEHQARSLVIGMRRSGWLP